MIMGESVKNVQLQDLFFKDFFSGHIISMIAARFASILPSAKMSQMKGPSSPGGFLTEKCFLKVW